MTENFALLSKELWGAILERYMTGVGERKDLELEVSSTAFFFSEKSSLEDSEKANPLTI